LLVSYTIQPPERQRRDDRQQELQGGVDPKEVRKPVATGTVHHQVRLVAHGRHKSGRRREGDRQHERKRVGPGGSGDTERDRNQQHDAAVVADEIGQQRGWQIEDAADDKRGEVGASGDDSVAELFDDTDPANPSLRMNIANAVIVAELAKPDRPSVGVIVV